MDARCAGSTIEHERSRLSAYSLAEEAAKIGEEES
jgi:hypothetical protein